MKTHRLNPFYPIKIKLQLMDLVQPRESNPADVDKGNGLTMETRGDVLVRAIAKPSNFRIAPNNPSLRSAKRLPFPSLKTLITSLSFSSHP